MCDGLPEGINCFCVWPFWCSELCSVDQTATVQRGSVLDVRGPEWFCHRFCSLWISTVPLVGRVVPMIRSAVRTTLRSLLWSDLVAELNQTVIDVQRTDSMMAEYNLFSSSCGRLNFLSWRRKSLVCQDVAEHYAVPCWLHCPQTCLLFRQTEEDPARVQWYPSGGPAPVFQMTSWPHTLEPLTCSHLVL